MIFKVRTEAELRRAIKLCTEKYDIIEIDGPLTVREPIKIPSEIVIRGSGGA